MKVSTDSVGDLLVPEELEKAYRAYLEKEGITEDDTDFDDFMMEHDDYDEKIVSNEMYDFLISFDTGIIDLSGGYPYHFEMEVPGYKISCYGWIGEDIKHPGLRMLATELKENE